MVKLSVVAGFLLASMILTTPDPIRAQATAAPPCAAPEEFTRLQEPLRRTGLALAAGQPVKIIAVGSSSTSGAGASSLAHTYPARLEAELRTRFPGVPITVFNRGVGGEDARQMLARFDQDVLNHNPDLVLWQVGTNAVLRDHALTGEAPLLREGIKRLKASQADIVLIDSQYAPKVLVKPNILGMLELLASTARDEKLGLFRRFAIMRHWHEVERISFETTLSPDGLHMNDWSYGCIAKLLSNALVEAARHPAVARAPARPR